VIEEPVSSTVLILAGSRLDKRKRAVKKLLDRTYAVEFKKPFDNQVPPLIRNIAHRYHFDISEDAVQMLFRLVGGQLFEIDLEIRKLIDYIGDGPRRIELEHVTAVVSQSREESVFDLAESLGRGDRVNALINLVRLLDQGQNEIGIVALLARHVRILMGILEGQKQGITGGKLAAHVGVPPFYVQKYIEQSRKWTLRRLEDVLLTLGDTDLALKSSPISSHIWLENLVIRSCRPIEQALA
jgi:DNA polymerase-3 subunit delta